MEISTDKIVPVSDFNKGKAGRIFETLEAKGEIFVMKNNRPAAVVVSVKRWAEMMEREESDWLARIARERLADFDENALVPNADVLAAAGLTQNEIDNAETPEIE